ncbi:MAG: MATE family efflux transporter, partial [Desulfovibrio sp.]
MLMMLSHFFIGFVDVYVAGRIGRDVQASLGLITQCLFFFLVLAIAVGNGTSTA